MVTTGHTVETRMNDSDTQFPFRCYGGYPNCSLVFLLVSSFFSVVSCQESATLPPPCPILSDTMLPGTPSPPFDFLATTGINISYPSSSFQLPFVAFIVDDVTDPGGVVLASDTIEIDRFLAAEPPIRGLFALFSQVNETLIQYIESIFSERLTLLPRFKASLWLEHLVFSSETMQTLNGRNSMLSLLAKSWQSPRLFVTAPSPGEINAPRTDGFYECYQWPPAAATYPIAGPVSACSEEPIVNVPVGSLLLVVNVTNEDGNCNAATATTWAQLNAPTAVGAIISSPSPALVGRNCDDTFVDDMFYPLLVSANDAAAFEARIKNGPPFNVSLNYTCDDSYWLGIDASGSLAVMGWRKYTEVSALRWMLDHFLYLDQVNSSVQAASGEVISLVPSGSVLNSFQKNITFPSSTHLRAYGSGALLDFKLRCSGIDDLDCGPWDRIISSYASCSQDGITSNIPPPPIEIARWITPFRRSTGRWISSASVLIGLVGNSSSPPPIDASWTCSITVVSCCEPWLGSLDLLLPTISTSPPPPFSVIPIIFPNQGSHFGPEFNINKTVLIETPPAFSRVELTAIISGHGSDPPPPASEGCEYAPTSHAFSIRPSGSASPSMIVNSSDIAYAQFMEAGSILGCANKVSLGVIANSHGDYRDGRNGWCPGQIVSPLVFDITDAFTGGSGIYEISYKAFSYWVDGSHPSGDGCGGDIYYSGVISFFSSSSLSPANGKGQDESSRSSSLSTTKSPISSSLPPLPCVVVGGSICGAFAYNQTVIGGALQSLGSSAFCGRGPGFMALSINTTDILYATTETDTPPPRDDNFAYSGVSGISTIRASCYNGNGGTSTFETLSHTSVDPSCHVAVHPSGKWVFSASYNAGSVSVMKIQADSTLGPAFTLQVGANAHAVNFDRSGKFIFVPCLGEDNVAQLVFDATTGVLEWNTVANNASLPVGSGPRHMVFLPTNPNLAFVLCELTSILVPFSLDSATGTLTPTSSGGISTIRTGLAPAQVQAAAEVLATEDGLFIYVTNRASPLGTGDNSVAIIPLNANGEIIEGSMSWATGEESGALNFPRHAMLSSAPGQPLLLVANQNGNTLTVFIRNQTTGELSQSSYVDSGAISSPIFLGELNA